MNPQDPRTQGRPQHPGPPPAASPPPWPYTHSGAPPPKPTSTGWPADAPPSSSRRQAVAIGSAATLALIIGGVIGGLVGSKVSGTNNSGTPTAVTVEAAAPQVSPTIPAAPDPVCAEWGPISNAYAAKQDKWARTDAKTPASAWSPEQRVLNMDMLPIIQMQAADMRRLADKAKDPFLARLMREQAMYEGEFALRLPNYEPSDQALWQAAIDYASAVRATCLTVKPR